MSHWERTVMSLHLKLSKAFTSSACRVVIRHTLQSGSEGNNTLAETRLSTAYSSYNQPLDGLKGKEAHTCSSLAGDRTFHLEKLSTVTAKLGAFPFQSVVVVFFIITICK